MCYALGARCLVCDCMGYTHSHDLSFTQPHTSPASLPCLLLLLVVAAGLAVYVQQALSNETLYNRHLEWKKKPLPKKFKRLAYPGMNPFCAVCDALACAHKGSSK